MLLCLTICYRELTVSPAEAIRSQQVAEHTAKQRHYILFIVEGKTLTPGALKVQCNYLLDRRVVERAFGFPLAGSISPHPTHDDLR